MTLALLGGCFDLLHAGHLDLMQKARERADIVLIALNSDASVRKLKGPGRPVLGIEKRIEALKRFAPFVSHCVVFEGDSPSQLIRDLEPHLFVKGREYATANLRESAALSETKCEAIFIQTDFPFHTSDLLGNK